MRTEAKSWPSLASISSRTAGASGLSAPLATAAEAGCSPSADGGAKGRPESPLEAADWVRAGDDETGFLMTVFRGMSRVPGGAMTDGRSMKKIGAKSVAANDGRVACRRSR
jgi:hypothetical protein